MAVGDLTTVQAAKSFGGIAAAGAPAYPAAVTLTPSGAGGSLASGTVYVKVTSINATGESMPSNEVSAVVVGPTASIAVAWAAVSGATSYRVYVGSAAGMEGQYFTAASPSFTITTLTGTAGSPPLAWPTSADQNLQTLVSGLSAWVTNYTARKFFSSSYNEIRDGTGGVELLLSNQPVISVQSLTIALVNIPAQPADGQPGYFLVPIAAIASVLSLYSYTFTRGKRNVRVTYTAGYPSVPLDLAQAVNEIVVSAYRRGTRGPDIDSHSSQITKESTHFDMSSLPKGAREILDYYKKLVPV